jgi:cystathionine beta-lyase/cystathionine gamma-synthase
VEKVIFPFDETFPQYPLARKQMSGACGLLTFVLKNDNAAAIETFCNRLQFIRMAVSWGGHESLIIPKVAGMKQEQFDASIPLHRSCRLYVGLEEAGFIISDLKQALG